MRDATFALVMLVVWIGVLLGCVLVLIDIQHAEDAHATRCQQAKAVAFIGNGGERLCVAKDVLR